MREQERVVFESLVAARGPALLRTAYLLTGDQQASEDLVQTALEKAVRTWDRIRTAGAVEAYIRSIMYRENVSIWRHRRGREVLTAEVPEQRVTSTPDDQVEERMLMQQALMGLGARQRTVLVLRYYEDLTEEQVARALDVNIGTVKSQTAKALRTLRRTIPTLTAEPHLSTGRRDD